MGRTSLAFVAELHTGLVSGFVEASLRRFAHGFKTKPVGYIGRNHRDQMKLDEFRPRLLQAVTPDERMTALCEFIEFWLGSRDSSFGEAPQELAERPLPMPLHRLYDFAGRWPSVDGQDSVEGVVPALTCQDSLLSVDKIKPTNDGKIIFLYENQGVWDCRTLPEGEDPPVWCQGDLMDEGGKWITGEKLVCDSLSRFLVTFVLQELTLGSRLYLCDEGLDQLFESDMDKAIPVWTDGPYVHGNDHHFYLWGSVLVGHFAGGYWHSANSPAGIDFLTANQGPVNRIGFVVGRPWNLDIRSDGSARLRFLRETIDDVAEAPAGTFDFQGLLKALSCALSDTGHYERNATVFFHREGQGGGLSGKHLHDSKLVRSLFNKVLDHATLPNPTLKRRVAAELTL